MDELKQFELEVYQEREWHAKELGIYKSIPHRYSNNLFDKVDSIYWKMCVPMIYAHWESFVVFLIRKTCEYINSEQISYKNVRKEIALYALEPQMKYLSGNAELNSRARFYDEFIELYNNPVYIDCGKVVSAKSNLNYKQLKHMLCCLGIEMPPGVESGEGIIEKLVAYRNKIAHGENSIVVHEDDVICFTKEIVYFFDELIIRTRQYLKEKQYLKQ